VKEGGVAYLSHVCVRRMPKEDFDFGEDKVEAERILKG
jgi:hypothetical protein